MHIEAFFEEVTATFTYVVVDRATKKCAVIDSVLDYDPASGGTSTESADQVIAYITKEGLSNEWILETHIHADHLTASAYLKEKIGGKTAMGARIKEVLDLWIPKFNTAHDTPADGSQFDHLFADNETFSIGDLKMTAWYTPGHTPACACYVTEGAAFVGDTIFAPRMGTARCDFPGGSAKDLYHSIQRLYGLPDYTLLYVGHDYPKEGEVLQASASVAEHKQGNVLISEKVSEAEYVRARNARDSGKPVPRLLLPSIQVNMRAGELGAAEDNGVQYIKIPLNQLKK